MDTKTIITIVATAVVTAVARRLIEAIEGWLKSKSIAGTVMATARSWLTLNRLAPVIDGAAILVLFHEAGRRFPVDAPVTGRDVPDLVAITALVALLFGSLIARLWWRSRTPPD